MFIFSLFSVNSFSLSEFIVVTINLSIHSLHICLSTSFTQLQGNISLDFIKRLESFLSQHI